MNEGVGGRLGPQDGGLVHVVAAGADHLHEDEGGLAVGRAQEIALSLACERIQLLVRVDELVQLLLMRIESLLTVFLSPM